MGQISKGTIAVINGTEARVLPQDSSDRPTAMLTIPYWLREGGSLKKGTEVVYVEFDDATGMILCRADGENGAQ